MGLGWVLCCTGLISHGLLGRRRVAAWAAVGLWAALPALVSASTGAA